jgi:hypothetical protein
MTVALHAASVDHLERTEHPSSKERITRKIEEFRAPDKLVPQDEEEVFTDGANFTPSVQIPMEDPYSIGNTDQDVTSGGGHLREEKLDYMIHLLESQRDIKTGSASEDLILYGFLGVFIIFVLDNFSRSAKYTR